MIFEPNERFRGSAAGGVARVLRGTRPGVHLGGSILADGPRMNESPPRPALAPTNRRGFLAASLPACEAKELEKGGWETSQARASSVLRTGYWRNCVDRGVAWRTSLYSLVSSDGLDRTPVQNLGRGTSSGTWTAVPSLGTSGCTKSSKPDDFREFREKEEECEDAAPRMVPSAITRRSSHHNSAGQQSTLEPNILHKGDQSLLEEISELRVRRCPRDGRTFV